MKYHGHIMDRGTTSACAENTRPRSGPPPDPRNYLRVRGEYYDPTDPLGKMLELPPRARRILQRAFNFNHWLGTTSACAENTCANRSLVSWLRNYLRVRGEYPCSKMRGRMWGELPPRARRIRFAPGDSRVHDGTTSACAENTADDLKHKKTRRNYLRVRGEYPK